jgi:dihydroorotate dehydrogenase (NAD+) catalytic subunit
VKARKRIVTSGASAPTRRRPTVRRIRPAIVPVPARSPRPGSPGGPATGSVPSAGDDAGAVATGVDLSVDLGRGLRLTTPVVLGSGAAGYGVELADALGPDGLRTIGALATRGTTLRPRPGNPGRRIAEIDGWLANAVGLANPGVDVVLERYAPSWAGWPVPVVVNLAAESPGEFAELAGRLDGVPGVAGIELNLSCPNAARGGGLFALDAASAAAATAAVRRATDLPLLVKLAAHAADPGAVARAVQEAGADVVVAVNTLPGSHLDARRVAGGPASRTVGLSGPPLRPVALRVVAEIARAVEVPVLAAGGIATPEHLLDALAVGARAVVVTTAALADPAIAGRLVRDLGDELASRGATGLADLVGTALARRSGPAAARATEYR